MPYRNKHSSHFLGNIQQHIHPTHLTVGTCQRHMAVLSFQPALHAVQAQLLGSFKNHNLNALQGSSLHFPEPTDDDDVAQQLFTPTRRPAAPLLRTTPARNWALLDAPSSSEEDELEASYGARSLPSASANPRLFPMSSAPSRSQPASEPSAWQGFQFDTTSPRSGQASQRSLTHSKRPTPVQERCAGLLQDSKYQELVCGASVAHGGHTTWHSCHLCASAWIKELITVLAICSQHSETVVHSLSVGSCTQHMTPTHILGMPHRAAACAGLWRCAPRRDGRSPLQGTPTRTVPTSLARSCCPARQACR